MINKYAANVIAENLYLHTDTDGNEFLLLKNILDHRSTDKDVKPEYAFEGDPKNRKYKKTTAGWELLVEWADKTQPQSWIPLKDLKESYPIQVAEYAEANGISGQTAFAWWIPYTLNKRLNMIYKVKSRYLKWTHKYSFEIPKTYKHVMQLDEKNGTNLGWIA